MVKNTINLLQKQSSEEVASQHKREARVIIVAAGVIFVVAVWVISFIVLQTYSLAEKRIQGEISEKEKTVASFSETELVYRAVINKAEAIKLIFNKQKILANGIVKLKTVLGDEVVMISLTLHEADLKMGINTFDIAATINYLTGLENENITQVFRDLTVSSVSIDTTGGYGVKIEGALVP